MKKWQKTTIAEWVRRALLSARNRHPGVVRVHSQV
jgi:hypothetical protein